jgi:sensor histidine kinase regulating citrate/malate metabolism
MPILATWVVDWSKVSELSFAAILSLGVGAALNWLLLQRQERFMKKMEQERAANDAKADQARTAALREIVANVNSTLKKISLDERNHETKLRHEDRWEARQRNAGS